MLNIDEEAREEDGKSFSKIREDFNRQQLKTAEIGDLVFCYMYGYGKIIHICPGYECGDLLIDWKNVVNVDISSKESTPFRQYVHFNHNNFKIGQWDEIFLERFVPFRENVKYVHGVAIPDITIAVHDYHVNEFFYPDIYCKEFYGYHSYPFCYNYMIQFQENQELLYPPTEKGKEAAILHAKAMLRIKE
jgi:hypothetical protein